MNPDVERRRVVRVVKAAAVVAVLVAVLVGAVLTVAVHGGN